MSKRTVQFSIYRYDPDKDDAPYMQDISVELEPTDRKLLDALTKLKAKDDAISYRRSCREGVCGSDAMNINGRNGLACLTNIDELKQPVVLRPLPGFEFDTDEVVPAIVSSHARVHFDGNRYSVPPKRCSSGSGSSPSSVMSKEE